MAELLIARSQEVIVILYAISLIFYFIDYLNKDVIAHRSAFWLLITVFVIQSGFLITHMFQYKRFPVLSLFEGIYFFSWLLILLSIILYVFSKVGFAVFFLNVIGFIFMTIYTFSPVQIEKSTIGDSLVSELLFIHVTFAISSYVAFAMSFVFGVLYLLLYQVLKKKKWSKQFSRLPSLSQTTKGMKVGLYTGIPLLFISLILGTQWAYVMLENWTIFDMKIVGSFFLIILYCSLVYLHKTGKLIANTFAWANVIAFLFVVINFFLGSRLSQFHFWV